MEITLNRTTNSSSSYDSNKSRIINITTRVKSLRTFLFKQSFHFSRHVLKLTNACSFAYNLQILSDTNEFMLGDEDQLLNKIISIPVESFILNIFNFNYSENIYF